MTPHPQRCETCDHCGNNPNDNYFCLIMQDDIDFLDFNRTAMVGCASHSSAKSEQEIRDGIIIDFESKLSSDLHIPLLSLDYHNAMKFVHKIADDLRSKQNCLRDTERDNIRLLQEQVGAPFKVIRVKHISTSGGINRPTIERCEVWIEIIDEPAGDRK